MNNFVIIINPLDSLVKKMNCPNFFRINESALVLPLSFEWPKYEYIKTNQKLTKISLEAKFKSRCKHLLNTPK